MSVFSFGGELKYFFHGVDLGLNESTWKKNL